MRKQAEARQIVRSKRTSARRRRESTQPREGREEARNPLDYWTLTDCRTRKETEQRVVLEGGSLEGPLVGARRIRRNMGHPKDRKGGKEGLHKGKTLGETTYDQSKVSNEGRETLPARIWKLVLRKTQGRRSGLSGSRNEI